MNLLRISVLSCRQLITHFKVFAKFTNPRALYLESSLCELYNQVNTLCPDLLQTLIKLGVKCLYICENF